MHIAIIGAGAAGMMAAATLCEEYPDTQVTLIEKNSRMGAKVIISGGGRCNVTTGLRDLKKVLKKYPRGERFLATALYDFSPEAVYAWFEAHGVPLKTEQDLRVFPVSNDGKDIVGVFERLFASSGVQCLLGTALLHVTLTEEGKFLLTLQKKGEEVHTLEVDKLLLTTGGEAYRHTGSTGDGYSFAQSLGHTITPLAPSLNAFLLKEDWPKTLSGLSFPKVRLTAEGFSEEGPMLFTHKGLTGPVVFFLSARLAFHQYTQETPLPLFLDLFPDLHQEALRDRLAKEIRAFPKKALKTSLGELLPKSFAEAFLLASGYDPLLHNGEVSDHLLHELSLTLKALPFSLVGRSAGDEFVTAGGVLLSEVNKNTMESLITPGLYFAGELLDVDGFTGGFNLQASWATGRCAGLHAGRD